MKKILILVLIIVILFVGLTYYFQYFKKSQASNFEECAAAGNPVMLSYPGKCRTPDGKLFIEPIEPELSE